MRVALTRIAEGRGTQADLDEIGLRLRTTQDKTDGAAKYLGARREWIAATWGAAIAQQIDMIVYRKMGPGQIRESLRALVASGTPSPDVAQHALDAIDQFSTLMAKAGPSKPYNVMGSGTRISAAEPLPGIGSRRPSRWSASAGPLNGRWYITSFGVDKSPPKARRKRPR